MISTRVKSRISKELSFPLGASQISEALEGVPQYAGLTVGFYPQWHQTPVQTKEVLDGGEPLCVMEARYRNVRPGRSGSQEGVASGWYDETWELAVYPVPRDRRSSVKTLLLTIGLPAIRAWLEMSRADTWRNGHHYCRLLIRFAEEVALRVEQA